MKYAKQIGLSLVCLGAMHVLKGMEETGVLAEQTALNIVQEKKEKKIQSTISIVEDSNNTHLVVFFKSNDYNKALKTNATAVGLGRLPYFSFLPGSAAQLNKGEDLIIGSLEEIIMKAHRDTECQRDLIVVPLSHIAQATDLSSIVVIPSTSGAYFNFDTVAGINLLKQHAPLLVGYRVGHFFTNDSALGKQRVSSSTIRLLTEFQKEVAELVSYRNSSRNRLI